MVPSGSVELLALKVQARLVQLLVNRAVGAWLTGGVPSPTRTTAYSAPPPPAFTALVTPGT